MTMLRDPSDISRDRRIRQYRQYLAEAERCYGLGEGLVRAMASKVDEKVEDLTRIPAACQEQGSLAALWFAQAAAAAAVAQAYRPQR